MSDDLDRLQRWVDSGARFRVLARRGDQWTLALLTCDGGEVMDRLTTADPAVAPWCAVNADSEVPGG